MKVSSFVREFIEWKFKELENSAGFAFRSINTAGGIRVPWESTDASKSMPPKSILKLFLIIKSESVLVHWAEQCERFRGNEFATTF